MSASRPRFSLAVHLYLVTFVLMLACLPMIFLFPAPCATIRPARWLIALAWFVLLAVLWRYVDDRCSSDRMRYRDGLLWVTASMMTGWVNLSFLIAFPVLLFVFVRSVLFAMVGDMRRSPGYSQDRWLGMVRYFYRNRMMQ